MPISDCLFFGCWNQAGHYLVGPNGRSVSYQEEEKITLYGDHLHLDGTLAPRRMRPAYGGGLVFRGSGATVDARGRIEYDAEEEPQGHFWLHVLDNGYTAIQWWDRCQGDTRGACNSTVLLKGEHTVDEMLAALREHFPHVLANLDKAGVKLVDVTPPKEE